MGFFFNDTATTEIYTLSLHDALPISLPVARRHQQDVGVRPPGLADQRGEEVVLADHRGEAPVRGVDDGHQDRKSTRLNSSHANISYAVFCLKKKKNESYSLIFSGILS